MLMVPDTVMRTTTELVTGLSFEIPGLSEGRELIPSALLQPVALPKKSLLEDIGLKNDPIHDLNTPFDDAFVEIEYRQPEPNDFVPPGKLTNSIGEGKVIHKVLPKQADVDKILKQINRKILHQTHFPESFKDISVTYLQSPHFCNIYMSL